MYINKSTSNSSSEQQRTPKRQYSTAISTSLNNKLIEHYKKKYELFNYLTLSKMNQNKNKKRKMNQDLLNGQDIITSNLFNLKPHYQKRASQSASLYYLNTGKLRNKKYAWQWINEFWNNKIEQKSQIYLEDPIVLVPDGLFMNLYLINKDDNQDNPCSISNANHMPLLSIPILEEEEFLTQRRYIEQQQQQQQQPLVTIMEDEEQQEDVKEVQDDIKSNVIKDTLQIHPAYIKNTMDMLLDTMRGDYQHNYTSLAYNDIFGGDIRLRTIDHLILPSNKNNITSKIHPAYILPNFIANENEIIYQDINQSIKKYKANNTNYITSSINHNIKPHINHIVIDHQQDEILTLLNYYQQQLINEKNSLNHIRLQLKNK